MIVKQSKCCAEVEGVGEEVRQPSEQDTRGHRTSQGLANSTVLFSAGGLPSCGWEEWTGLVPRT